MIVHLAGNLREELFCRSVVEQTVAELGGLDVPVNNAGLPDGSGRHRR